jgi:lipid-A-disaccharide synthase
MLPNCDLFVCCGEASGDAYGAAIVQDLLKKRPDLVVGAMGGPALQAAGAEIEQGIDGLAVMGFLPVLARLPEFIALGRRVAGIIRARRPRVVLTIDYPGFNLRLLRQLRDLRASGTRFIHVVAPQVWAWKPRRAKRIAQTVDRLLCFFPFEPPLFNRFAAARADFVGHPLVDLVDQGGSDLGLSSELNLQPADRLVLIAPGSRAREITSLLPIFDRAFELIQSRLTAPGGRVVAAIAATPEVPRTVYRAHSDLPLVEGRYRQLCARAHVGLIASGTATLEAALLGLPHVLAYRTDVISGRLARHLLLVDHIGLPNLVHGRRVCPEVLQDELTPERLAAHLQRLWEGPHRERCVRDLADVARLLGGGGAMARIASILDQELSSSDAADED